MTLKDIGYIVRKGYDELDDGTFADVDLDDDSTVDTAFKAIANGLKPFAPLMQNMDIQKDGSTYYLQMSDKSSIFAEVVIDQAGEAYTLRNPMTDDFMMWVWTEDDVGTAGNDHKGYGIGFDIEHTIGMMTDQTEIDGFWAVFGSADTSEYTQTTK